MKHLLLYAGVVRRTIYAHNKESGPRGLAKPLPRSTAASLHTLKAKLVGATATRSLVFSITTDGYW